MPRWPRWLVCAAVLGCALAGCQVSTPVEGGGDVDGSSTPRAVRSPAETGPDSGGSDNGGSGSGGSGSDGSGGRESTTPETPAESAAPPERPSRFDAGRAMATVRRLAGGIGPR
ncbi:MAG: hypothetical protein M3211_10080, partial [Actinomycetota bacterium]|nr:hypothetical protein [Actinomycetota bacterium]